MNKENKSLRGMIYASLFGAGTAVGALITIPLSAIPITLQTLFLYIAAGLLGGRLGALSQFVYILLGIIGLPVFSNGQAGFGILLGKSGGYIIGFLLASFLIGKLIEVKKKPGPLWIGLSMVIGTIVIYILGVAQLSYVMKLSILKAASVGALPFIIGDLLKIIVAVIITLKVRDKIHIREEKA